MYGKLINGRLSKAKHFIVTNKETILNPTDEMYKKHGFKIVREDEIPKLTENQIINIRYEETEDEIIKHYDIERADVE